jgi:hypothetical protein
MRINRKISSLMCIASISIGGLARADQLMFMVPNGSAPDMQPYVGKTYINSASHGETAPIFLGLLSENQIGSIIQVEHAPVSKSFLDRQSFLGEVTVFPGKPESQNLLLQSVADAPVKTGQYEHEKTLITLEKSLISN